MSPSFWPSLWNDEPSRPLKHLRVIDFTVMLPGPFITRTLAQYGAEVIKVESLPSGDPLRQLGGTALWKLLNQGKKSLALDLRSARGIDAVRAVVAESNVFVESFREGVAEGMGLGYAELSERNPDLVYVSLRGYSGKRASRSGHDLGFIANSGCAEWFLENSVPNYSTFFADLVGGSLIPSMRLLAHLANPERRGMHLICAMDEGFRALYLPRAFDEFHREQLPVGEQSQFGIQRHFDGSLPHSRWYRCRDAQWVALSAVQPKHWQTFCEAVEKPQWVSRASDPNLVADLEVLFSSSPSSYWESLFLEREACCVRAVSWQEHLRLTDARNLLATDPLRWCGFSPNAQLAEAPSVGKDSYPILKSLGWNNREIAEVLGQQPKEPIEPKISSL